MTLVSTQPLTEMNAKNLPGSKVRPAHKANITAVCYRKNWSFLVSKSYRFPRFVKGIVPHISLNTFVI
jgi:hypothetical protein